MVNAIEPRKLEKLSFSDDFIRPDCTIIQSSSKTLP